MKKSNKNINKNVIYLSLAVLVLAIVIFIIKPFSDNQNLNQNQNSINRQNCLAEDCLLVDNLDYPAGELSSSAKDSLNEAIKDEYKAYSTYQAVIKKFGNVRPFSMIIRAEEQHISLLKSIYDKYGLTVPENTMAKTVTLPATLQQACQVGVEAEISNAALYLDKLLPTVTDYPDITQVFKNLMDASEQKHLPAFQRCQ